MRRPTPYAQLAMACLAALFATVGLLPAAQAAGEQFTIRLDASGATFQGYGLSGWTLVEEEPGERLVWEITADPGARPRLVGQVTESGYFEIGGPRQMVPRVEGRLLFPVGFSVDDTENPARVVNVTTSGGEIRHRMAFPMNDTGKMRISLERDVTPPNFTVGSVERLDHFSFYLETTSNEPTIGTLSIWPAEGGEPVLHPTPDAATLHRFPIQGLDPETEYVFNVRFEDWALHTSLSQEFRVTTLAVASGTPPTVTYRYPEPNATFAKPPSHVEARWAAGAGEVPEGEIRLFVDKTEVTSALSPVPGGLRYVPPEPFAPGPHSIGLELTNTGGGRSVVTWSFTVEERAAPGSGVLAAVAVAVAVALGARRRVRHP